MQKYRIRRYSNRKENACGGTSFGATEDRVVGSINIEKALKEGMKALEPGILADANRNILYVMKLIFWTII